ncbi:MAG: ABC transporter ATP-binding protein [Beijerinckiaceae bacterium]|nr:ABC transporter ATP-binding protein [Beijerinckiaceae bacterium]
MTVLSVKGLTKSFGGPKVVDNVSFALEAGEMLALIGPNGAGKSTCFNIINGQLSRSAGEIRILGVDTSGLDPSRIWRLGVGRTFQITETFLSMTVIENVQMALFSHHRLLTVWRKPARHFHAREAEALLDLVGMAEFAGRPCRQLAYGDLKRLELAIALANEPKLLLMDEPAAGMAPRERGELMSLAARIAKTRAIGILFTEHDMDVVFEHADRIMVLNRGVLIFEGLPEAVRRSAEVQAVYLGAGTLYAESHA